MAVFTVVDAKPWHCGQIIRRLRPDMAAILAARGADPHAELRACFDASSFKRAWFADDCLMAVGGVTGSHLDTAPVVWLAVAHDARRYKIAMMREAKRQIAALLQTRHELIAAIYPDDSRALSFAERIGFASVGAGKMAILSIRRRALFRDFHVSRAPAPWRVHQTPVRRLGIPDAPFIIYTAGRSRTAWLSAFLSYHDTQCHNEVAICFRRMDDVAAFFAAGRTGSAETAAAPGWRLINHYVPNMRSVVVRRPIEEIIASFARSEVAHIAAIDEDRLRRIITYEDRCLQQISAQPGTLTVDFSDLGQAETCARVFEHCLPYRFDRGWWEFLRGQNIQTNVADLFSYYRDNRDAVERFKRDAKRDMIALARAGAFTLEA